MNVEHLQKKKEAVETLFNRVKAERDAAQSKIESLNVELNKLQGEFRVYEELISNGDWANTVSVEEKSEDAAK